MALRAVAASSGGGGGGGQLSLQFQDETVNLGSAGTVDTLNFVGAAVTATRVSNTVTVTVVGGSQAPLQFQDEGTNLGSAGSVDTFNIVGSGLLATRAANTITLTGASDPQRTLVLVIDGNGNPLTTGTKGYLEVPFTGTITQWKLLADQPGSLTMDVWKLNAAIPSDANRIAGTDKPTLSAAQRAVSTALTGWTTAVAINDTFGFEIESANTITRATLEIVITTT